MTFIHSARSGLRPMLAVCLMLYSFSAIAANTVQLSQQQLDNLGVTLGKLIPTRQIPALFAPATVAIPPARDYIVSASQPGLITRLYAAMGDKVKKGDSLAQINSPALLALQGHYLKAGSILNLATATYNRDKKLLKEGVISNRREQETLSQYNAAVLDFNEAKQLLQIAGMSASAINRLDRTHSLDSQLTVHAPVSGIVIERLAVTGTRIDSLAPLYRIADLNELWLEINIPQERMGTIKIGDKVLIENTAISAVITVLGQSVNPENQTVPARAIIKDKHTAVRVGQKVNIQIIQTSDKAIFTVPDTAVAQHEGKAFVFIRNATGFEVIPVTVIGKQEHEAIISGSFTGNEDIAIKGAVALKANWLGLGSLEHD